MSLADVCELYHMHRNTVWRRVKADPTFPKPVHLSSRPLWLQSEVYAFIAERRAVA